MTKSRADLLHGTLDHLILRTLSLGSMHGWAIAKHIGQVSGDVLEDRISADLRSPRFHTFLLSAFSLTAVILTLAGIYGLMLYLVTGRTREIGIRSALGAGVTHVLWTVSRQCLLLISLGLVAGIGIAAMTSRLLGALLFAVSPVDAPTFGLVAAGLGLTALLACLMPAWRATRVEPTTALRWE